MQLLRKAFTHAYPRSGSCLVRLCSTPPMCEISGVIKKSRLHRLNIGGLRAHEGTACCTFRKHRRTCLLCRASLHAIYISGSIHHSIETSLVVSYAIDSTKDLEHDHTPIWSYACTLSSEKMQKIIKTRTDAIPAVTSQGFPDPSSLPRPFADSPPGK